MLQGLRAMQIEESAKEIRKNVEKLEKHIAAYHQYHTKLGTQINTVANTYDKSSNEFKKIDKDVRKVTGQDRELVDTPPADRVKSE